MQTQHFSIMIDAPKEKVWHSMLDDETYRDWTAAFSEGSYYEGAWEEAGLPNADHMNLSLLNTSGSLPTESKIRRATKLRNGRRQMKIISLRKQMA